MSEIRTFCRICNALCGIVATVDGKGKRTEITSCSKRSEDALNTPFWQVSTTIEYSPSGSDPLG